jgi:hypothetical protein
MIEICPAHIAPLVQSRCVPLRELIRIAKASGKKPARKITKTTPPKSRKEYDRLYYLTNRERKLAAQAEYDATHKEQINEYHRKRYQRRRS